MKKRTALLLATSICALAAPAFAGERAGAFSISPFVGGYTFDGVQHLETGPLQGLRLGYDLTKNWGVELVGDYVSTKGTRSDTSVNKLSYHLDLVYNIMPDGPLVPYIALGGGAITSGHGKDGLKINDRNTDAAANAGFGLKYFMTDSMALRADARQVFLLPDHGSVMYNWEYTAGLTFLFGGTKTAARALAQESTPVVAPAPVVEPVKEEPLPPIAAAEPTPERFKYCITLHTEFDVDKTEIRPEYGEEITKVGSFMKQYPTTTAVIEGHTDNVGDAEYNMKLSKLRAESVVNYLVDKLGIDRSRLSAVGFGASRPIADNATDAGKQANRRMDAIIDCAFDVKKIAPPDRLCLALNIEFDRNKADITPQHNNEIAKVGEYMKQYPTTTAVIEGHTDNEGDAGYNMKLSKQRADNVVAYLVKNFGIDPSRLEAKGYGATRRIAYNSTPEGRQKNRRINAIIDCVVKK